MSDAVLNQSTAPAVAANPQPNFVPALARVSWGAIFAGSAIALAVTIMLGMLGLGLGAASIDPLEQGESGGGLMTGSAIFVIVVQLVALGVGGFVAARLAGVPIMMSSALHGAAVWAIATLAAAWLATTAMGAMISGGASMLSSATSTLSQVGSAVIPDDFEMPEITPSNLQLSDLPQPVQEVMKENGVTPERFAAESKEMFLAVFSQSEQRNAQAAVSAAVKKTLADPSTAEQNLRSLGDQLSAKDGIFSEQNKREAMAELNTRFGISEQDAEQAYDQVVQQANEAITSAQASIADLKQQSLQAADAAAEGISKAGFGAFLASLLGLIAAMAAAAVGRPKTIVGSEVRDYAR